MKKSQEELSRIIDENMEEIQAGRLNPDLALERYSVSASEVKPQLEAALRLFTTRTRFDPRPGYIQTARYRLVKRIQAQEARRARSRRGFLRTRSNARAPLWRPAWQLALALILVLCFVSAGGAMVASAQSAVPGDRLYGLKIAQENLSLATSLTKAGDARQRVRFTERRLVEIETLILEGRYPLLDDGVAALDEQIGLTIAALQALAGEDPAEAGRLAIQLQNVLREETQAITGLSAALPPESQGEIQEALEISRSGLLAAAEIGRILEPQPQGETPSGPDQAAPTPVPVVSETPVPEVTESPTQSASATPGETPSETPSGTPTGTATTTSLPSETPEASQTPIPPTLTASPPAGPGAAVTPTKKATITPKVKPERKNPPKPTKEAKPTKELPEPTRRPPRP